MAGKHLKRLAAPKSWKVVRKSSKLIVRPRGSLEASMPVALLLREKLGVVATRREVRRIMNDGVVSIDGRVVKEDKLPLCIMSVLGINGVGSFRMLFDRKGSLCLRKVDDGESHLKPCKVVSKTYLRGKKVQVGFHDGRTMLSSDSSIMVHDTVIFRLPGFKIEKHIRLQKGCAVYLTGGSSIGSIGVLEGVGSTVSVKIGDRVIETAKSNVFAVGEGSPLISLND